MGRVDVNTVLANTHFMPPDWRDDAACLGTDPDIFWADEDEQMRPARLRYVTSIFCDRCPVRQQCYDYAKTNQLLGIWGGRWFTERNRNSDPRP